MIFVVEGKTDTAKLKSIFPEIVTIETHGLSVPKNVVETIVEFSKTNEIVILTDPDGPGKIIRQKIIDAVPNSTQVFVDPKKSRAKNKIGVAQASNEAIIEAINNSVKFTKETETISYSQFLECGLNGKPDSKQKREKLCKKFGIIYCNAKTLFKWLNLMQKSLEDINDI